MMVLRTEVARLPTHLGLQILLRPELTQAVPILSPLQGQPRLQTCLENLLLGAGQLEPYLPTGTILYATLLAPAQDTKPQ